MTVQYEPDAEVDISMQTITNYYRCTHEHTNLQIYQQIYQTIVWMY